MKIDFYTLQKRLEKPALAGAIFFLMSILPAQARDVTPSPFWKNQIVFASDPFIYGNDPFSPPAAAAGESGWVKFTILRLAPYDPNVVYFQDSSTYTFHYDFATTWLDPFIGMGLNNFYQVTLYPEAQQAILGTVLFPPSHGFPCLTAN